MPAAPHRLEELAAQLKELTNLLSGEDKAGLPGPRAKRVRETITEAYDTLRRLVDNLDPIKHPGFVFDPSNPSVAGRIAGVAMIAQPRKPLANIERFYGSGVYALYYNGDFPAYREISKREQPIYVGKVDPADLSAKIARDQGDRLANRLNDHRRTISKAADTLRLEDFEYRALVVQTGWQTSAEQYLIELFKPIWNNETAICYGFGKHGDAPETRGNLRSPWDTLHAGRDWAHRDPEMKDARTEQRIIEDIHEHLSKYPPVNSIDEILRRFLDEMRAES
jgi:hypothetical protein